MGIELQNADRTITLNSSTDNRRSDTVFSAKKNRKLATLEVRFLLDRLINAVELFFRCVSRQNRRECCDAIPSKVAEQFFVKMLHLIGNIENCIGTASRATKKTDRPFVGDGNDSIARRERIAPVIGKRKK